MRNLKQEKGFALIEILIAIGIVASLSAVALPNILRMRTNANDVAAKAAIRTIAYAAEEYAVRNGRYPTHISELTQTNPPYLSEDYTASSQDGYTFTCSWSSTEYSCTATPVESSTTGNKIYTMASGIVQGESMAVITTKLTSTPLDNPITLARLKDLIDEPDTPTLNTNTTTPTSPTTDPYDDPGIIIVLDDPGDNDGIVVVPDGIPPNHDPTDPTDEQTQSAVAQINGI